MFIVLLGCLVHCYHQQSEKSVRMSCMCRFRMWRSFVLQTAEFVTQFLLRVNPGYVHTQVTFNSRSAL
jgi:hypothetical protein